jgi:outer membrane immunogenic protein
LALAFASAGIIPPASAADDLDRPGAEGITSWSGFHAGIGGGYGTALHEVGAVDGHASYVLIDDFDALGDSSGLLTGEAGFDLQLSDRFVLGVLGDFTWANFDSSFAVSCSTAPSDPCIGSRGSLELENMWTLAGRLGLASSPRTLWYGVFGWTHADFDASMKTPNSGAAQLVGRLDPSSPRDGDRHGITLGLGIESALTDVFSLKLEYRYTDFDSVDGSEAESDISSAVVEDAKITSSVQTVRGVLSWRFNFSCVLGRCPRDVRSLEKLPDRRPGKDKELHNGCEKVAHAPQEYSRDTVEICEIANSL